jgi:hypothetical protein
VGARLGRRAVAVATRLQQDDAEGRLTLEQLTCGVEGTPPRQRHHDQVDRLGRGERARLLSVGHLADHAHMLHERRAQPRPEARIPVDDESTCPRRHWGQ